MRIALLLASLLVAAAVVAAAPAASAGPVRDACYDHAPHVNCGGLFVPCRSNDPELDYVCREYYNPLVGGL